jgi:ATP-dependent DNA ligase
MTSHLDPSPDGFRPEDEWIVAKRRDRIYRPGYRGWTKIKNPTYWRREREIAHVERSRERRAIFA